MAKISAVRISLLGVSALLFCVPQLASGQILSVSCTPVTGPAQAGVMYSATCTASGGIAPYSWSISAGALPAGLSITPSNDTTSATLAGIPTTAGAYDYTSQVTDSTPVIPMTAQQDYSGSIAPNLIQISPTTSFAGGPAFTVTVTGAGFGGDSVVNFNGTALATTVLSLTQVTAVVPANLTASAGTFPLTVTSGGATSNSANFTVVPPSISSLSPSTVISGASNFTLTVNGSAFALGSVVQWTNSGTTTMLTTNYVGSTELTASVPASLIATAGSASINVISGVATSNALSFIVTPGPALTSLNPSTTTAGGPAFALTLNGSGFTSGTVAQWNGSALSTTFNNATQIVASVPASLLATAGSASINVTSGGVTSNALSFTVTPGAALTSLSPSTTTAAGPEFTLTVNGTGFLSGAVVEWNSTVLSTTFNTATQLTARIPANLISVPGTTPVTVVSGGVTSNALSFTVIAGPAVTSLNPSAITAGSGAGLNSATNCPANIQAAGTLAVNGSGFTQNATVQWNGQSLSTTFVNGNQLMACVPSAFVQVYGTAQITVALGSVMSNALSISLGVPTITLTGLQSTSVPTQQLPIGLQLASATPIDLTGTLQLSFNTSAPELPAEYMDPSLQFAAGGTTLQFTIPAGASSISSISGGMIQQGTVEGTITVTLTSLTAGGVNILPAIPITGSITVPTLAPVITTGSAQITNVTSGGFDVVVTGYSTTRDMTSATFAFAAAPGTSFTGTTNFSIPLSSDFNTWFSSATGQSNGSMFLLTVHFTTSGSINVLQSVTITLANSAGNSNSAVASR